MSYIPSKNILIIQTAFIGDTILASQFARTIKRYFPQACVHFLLRKGNETVIQGLDFIDHVWVWDKSQGKWKNLFKLIAKLRHFSFEHVFNLHRHFNSGLVTMFMKSPSKVGFKQNPLSFFYDQKVNHQIPHPHHFHEVQRNLELLEVTLSKKVTVDHLRPSLPMTDEHKKKIEKFIPKDRTLSDYFVVAPASVWKTKAWSPEKFKSLVVKLNQFGTVYLVGAPSDKALCDDISSGKAINLCGLLSLLESAALMKFAKRVFVNDSGPLHLASAVNAPTTAIFCSTIPDFGYFPLAEQHCVVEISQKLSCRPCGLHGHNKCPKVHFRCSEEITIEEVLIQSGLLIQRDPLVN